MRSSSGATRCLAGLWLALGAFGCGSSEGDDAGAAPPPFDAGAGPWQLGEELPASEQEPGDAKAGKDALLNGSFMSCGIPLRLWDNSLFGSTIQGLLPTNGGETGVKGRTGRNAELPHTLTAFTTSDGAEVVNGNCLTCHSAKFDGELVMGLGNAAADFTSGIAGGFQVNSIPDAALTVLGLNAAERTSLRRMMRTATVFGNWTAMRTIGQNPAEMFTGLLMAHHDLDTLEWSDEQLRPLVIRDEEGKEIAAPLVSSDPPAWWRVKKKNALFYNGMARGDHRGTMALATSVCVDNVTEAKRVDAILRDIQAYVRTIVAPRYPRKIDRDLADDGRQVFMETCAGCHGTYADDPQDDASDTYPNLLIPLDEIGTDPVVANLGVIHAPEFAQWYNQSFYGKITPAAPGEPFAGYMPPPLDGIWATAPFLHNGAVPSIAVLLDSKKRPAVWRRTDLQSTSFDEGALGWMWEEVPYSQEDAPEDERKMIYDTSHWSQSNVGHTYGDDLSEAQRRAVIEYLKTL
jgi:mono/diheme cytochrome c family protein